MKTEFTAPFQSGYDVLATETSVAGRGNPEHERRDSATLQALFLCLQTINGGLRGATERLAGVLSGRFSTPALVRHFRCGKRNGGLQFLKGVRIMSSFIRFSFGSHKIRVTDHSGEPWFVLRDLLAGMASKTTTTAAVESIKQILGLGLVRDIPVQTAGGKQVMIIVAEPAAAHLLSHSNTDKGRELNRFVHEDVLPAIRKSGRNWLEQISSSSSDSISPDSTKCPQLIAGSSDMTWFYSLNLALDVEKIEKSHSDNSCNVDVKIGISPSPAAGNNLSNHVIFKDPATDSLATHIFNIWYGTIGEGAYTTAEVIERTAANPYMTAALLEVAYNRKNWDRVCPRRFGIWLAKHENWTDGLLRVAPPKYNTNRKIRLWAVQQVPA